MSKEPVRPCALSHPPTPNQPTMLGGSALVIVVVVLLLVAALAAAGMTPLAAASTVVFGGWAAVRVLRQQYVAVGSLA